jgi:hypothetical protein
MYHLENGNNDRLFEGIRQMLSFEESFYRLFGKPCIGAKLLYCNQLIVHFPVMYFYGSQQAATGTVAFIQ